MKDRPSLFEMTRAPFLSSIIAPLTAGTLLCVKINGSFSIPGFILVMITGMGLHAATNVYNDIYDTIQGTDMVNVHRNEFSGGSGVLQDYPELMPKMFFIARTALAVSFLSTAALTVFTDSEFRFLLWGLFAVSAFFSKYYTAAPVKLAYRGMGEVSVWLSFGPMAVMIASVSQNTAFTGQIAMFMPLCGLSTLSILLIGQMIDIDADRKGGKHGVASRLGTGPSAFLYILVQLGIIANVISFNIYSPFDIWPLLLSLLPYIILFPKTASIVAKHHGNPGELKNAAKMTVLIHMLFSLLLTAGLAISLFL